MKILRVFRSIVQIPPPLLFVCIFAISCSLPSAARITRTQASEVNSTGIPANNAAETNSNDTEFTAEATASQTLTPLVESANVITSTETITASASPTSAVSASPGKQPTPNEVGQTDRLRYLILNDYNQQLVIVNSLSGSPRILDTDLKDSIRLVSFSNNGCELIVRQGNKRIVRLDLEGRLIQELLPPYWYQGKGTVIGEAVSPSGIWMVYLVGLGNQGYNSFEMQNIEMVNHENMATSTLADRGGGWVASWSPDGSMIAFGDNNEQNINQIFIASGDGKDKIQLTNFTDEDVDIRMIKWSPNGKKIAFQRFKNGDYSISFWIMIIENGGGMVKTYTDVPPSIRNLFWQDDHVLVIHTAFTEQTGMNEETIIWLDTNTGELIDTLKASETPDKSIVSVNSYDNGVIGFFSDKSF